MTTWLEMKIIAFGILMKRYAVLFIDWKLVLLISMGKGLTDTLRRTKNTSY